MSVNHIYIERDRERELERQTERDRERPHYTNYVSLILKWNSENISATFQIQNILYQVDNSMN